MSLIYFLQAIMGWALILTAILRSYTGEYFTTEGFQMVTITVLGLLLTRKGA